MAIEILHLSSVVRSALVDRDGDRLGRVEDLIAQLGFAPHPPVTGVVVRIARRQLFVPIDRIPDLQPGRVAVRGRHRQPQALRAAARRGPAVARTCAPGT